MYAASAWIDDNDMAVYAIGKVNQPRVSAIDLVLDISLLQIQQVMFSPLRSWTMNMQCSKQMLSGQRLHQSVVHMIQYYFVIYWTTTLLSLNSWQQLSAQQSNNMIPNIHYTFRILLFDCCAANC